LHPRHRFPAAGERTRDHDVLKTLLGPGEDHLAEGDEADELALLVDHEHIGHQGDRRNRTQPFQHGPDLGRGEEGFRRRLHQAANRTLVPGAAALPLFTGALAGGKSDALASLRAKAIEHGEAATRTHLLQEFGDCSIGLGLKQARSGDGIRLRNSSSRLT
jgi:hypothetical protein